MKQIGRSRLGGAIKKVANQPKEIISRYMLIVGIVIVVCWSIGGRIFKVSFMLEYISLADNISTALIIPPIVLWLTKHISQRIRVYEDKPMSARIIEAMGEMNSRLWKLGISLREVVEEKALYDEILEKIRESKNRLVFSFLLLDPKSEFLKQREIEEDGEETGRLRTEVNDTIKKLEGIKKSLPNLGIENIDFDYRTYDAMPTYSLILVDDKLFVVGPYLYRERGTKTPWMEISNKDVQEEYKEAFRRLWERSKEPSSSFENHGKSS